MQIINAIEISPLSFPKDGYTLPEISDFPDPKQWYEKWVENMSVLNLNPICEGSYLVDIETIDDENLEIILRGFQFDEFENVTGYFDGGIALMENNKALILPTCCGDIGNIKEWKRILEDQSEEWNELWIGHPWIFYKKVNGKVQLSDYSDDTLKESLIIHPIIEIDELELKTELEKAEKKQINFKNGISKLLEKMKVKNFDKISEMLTGI